MKFMDQFSSRLAIPLFFATVSAANLAGAEQATENELSLTFGWDANLVAVVETQRGRIRRHFLPGATADEVSVRYLLETSEKTDGIRVSHSELETISSTDNGREAIQSALQFTGLITDYSVSNDGQFQGIENASSTSKRVRQLISSTLSGEAIPDGVTALLQQLCSEPTLTGAVETQWDRLVGFWSGQQLEVESAYGAQGQVSHPVIPGVPVPVNVEYGILGRVPCAEGAETLACVELLAFYEYDVDAMRSGAIQVAEQLSDPAESARLLDLTFSEYSEEILVVSDPTTLLPYRYEYRKTIDGVSEENGRYGRVDYVISVFSCR